jgi:adenylosuccinate synthase
MTLTEIVGGFYGDEGKGTVVAYIILNDKVDAAVRSQGPQAGHTVFHGGEKYVFRQIPSAIFNLNTQLLIAAGAFVRPDVVLEEVERFKSFNVESRLRIDENATAILPQHIEREKELMQSIGSVGTGVGPAYADRVMRKPEVLVKFVPSLEKFSKGVNVSNIVNDCLDEGKSVFIEGAHGTFLSNFHGPYPYTNAYDNTASALLSQVGIGPKKADKIIVVFKSFVSRVAAGPLEGEIPAEEAERLGWIEYGTVSGRRRRVAPFDVKLAKNSIRLNTPTDLAITKMDVLFPNAHGITDYSKLPYECQQWIEDLEKKLCVPITLIKTGPEIRDIIDLREEKGTI